MDIVSTISNALSMLETSAGGRVARGKRASMGVRTLLAVLKDLVIARERAALLIDDGLRNSIVITMGTVERAARGNLAAGLMGACCGSVWREAMYDLESDITLLIEATKVGLMPGCHAEMCSMPNEATPEWFWWDSFRDRASVDTKEFDSAIHSDSQCNGAVSKYVASIMSNRGVVRKDRFMREAATWENIGTWVLDMCSKGAKTAVIPGHVRSIRGTLASSGLIVTWSSDATIKTYYLLSDTVVLRHVLIGHELAVNDACIAGGCLISVSSDHTIRRWSTDTGEPVSSTRTRGEAVSVACAGGCHAIAAYVLSEVSLNVLVHDLDTDVVVSAACVPGASAVRVHDANTLVVASPSLVTLLSAKGLKAVRCVRIHTRDWYPRMCDSDTGTIALVRNEFVYIEDGNCLCTVGDVMSRAKLVPDEAIVLRMRHNDDVLRLLCAGEDENGTFKRVVVSFDARTGSMSAFTLRDGDNAIDFVVEGRIIIFCSVSGVMWWTDDVGNAIGTTCNDQKKISNSGNVMLAACDNRIAAGYDDKVRIWDRASDSIVEHSVGMTMKGLLYHMKTLVVYSSSSMRFIDEDMNTIRTVDISVPVKKIHSVGDFLAATRLDGIHNDVYKLSPETGKPVGATIKATALLFSTDSLLFVSHLSRVRACSPDTFDVVNEIDHESITPAPATSGCMLDNNVYTLHPPDVVVMWRINRRFSISVPRTEEKKVFYISRSVREIRAYDGHIIGLTVTGFVFVYDKEMRMIKQIASHLSQSVYGTPNKDVDEILVSDHVGVLKVLAQTCDSNASVSGPPRFA